MSDKANKLNSLLGFVDKLNHIKQKRQRLIATRKKLKAQLLSLSPEEKQFWKIHKTLMNQLNSFQKTTHGLVFTIISSGKRNLTIQIPGRPKDGHLVQLSYKTRKSQVHVNYNSSGPIGNVPTNIKTHQGFSTYNRFIKNLLTKFSQHCPGKPDATPPQETKGKQARGMPESKKPATSDPRPPCSSNGKLKNDPAERKSQRVIDSVAQLRQSRLGTFKKHAQQCTTKVLLQYLFEPDPVITLVPNAVADLNPGQAGQTSKLPGGITLAFNKESKRASKMPRNSLKQQRWEIARIQLCQSIKQLSADEYGTLYKNLTTKANTAKSDQDFKAFQTSIHQLMAVSSVFLAHNTTLPKLDPAMKTMVAEHPLKHAKRLLFLIKFPNDMQAFMRHLEAFQRYHSDLNDSPKDDVNKFIERNFYNSFTGGVDSLYSRRMTSQAHSGKLKATGWALRQSLLKRPVCVGTLPKFLRNAYNLVAFNQQTASTISSKSPPPAGPQHPWSPGSQRL